LIIKNPKTIPSERAIGDLILGKATEIRTPSEKKMIWTKNKVAEIIINIFMLNGSLLTARAIKTAVII